MMNQRKAFLSVAALTMLLLQGCGGGGGGNGDAPGASSGAGGTPSTPSTQPSAGSSGFVAQSAVGKMLQGGVYAVSYGKGSINFKDDKSIWRTTLEKKLDGSYEPVSRVYAGNDQVGNDVLDESLRPLYDPSAKTYTQILSSRLDDANGKILIGQQPAASFVARYAWKVDVDAVDLAGSAIQKFLSETFSQTKPIDDLAISGNFPAGSQGYRIAYSADVNRFLFERNEVFVRSQAEFERSGSCGTKSGAARIGYLVQSGGVLEIYEIGSDTNCNAALDAGTLIGAGSWVRKAGDGFDYIEITFPSGISYARFDSKFSEAEYAGGVRAVELIAPNGIWSSGYLIPAGVKFRARNLAINKVAADALKAAAPM